MQIIDIESLIGAAEPVSPDGKYSLVWSSAGVLGVRKLSNNDPVLAFRENHGNILRAGFSPAMRQIVAENEDGSFSVWFTTGEIAGAKCVSPENIVLFMSGNDRVPYPNISHRRNYRFFLRDFTSTTLDYYLCFPR